MHAHKCALSIIDRVVLLTYIFHQQYKNYNLSRVHVCHISRVSIFFGSIVNPEFHVGVKEENNVCMTHPL